jgi:hypothetical protein
MKSTLFGFVFLMQGIIVLAQSDSIFVKNSKEFKTFNLCNVKHISLDFTIKNNFPYELIPDSIKSIRFLRQSRLKSGHGAILTNLETITKVELNGNLVKLLQELLEMNKSLDTVILCNTKISNIWADYVSANDRSVSVLVLKKVKFDEPYWMYKKLFFFKRLKFKSIIVVDHTIDNSNLIWLFKVFNPDYIYYNGHKLDVESVYFAQH